MSHWDCLLIKDSMENAESEQVWVVYISKYKYLKIQQIFE